MNATNEKLVIRLNMDEKFKEKTDISIVLSLYSLGDRMDNALLAVRFVNHKYIVVGGKRECLSLIKLLRLVIE